MAYPHVPGDLPLTDRVAERFMLLPSGYFIGDADIRDIVGLLSFLSTNAKSVMDRMHTNRSKLNESR
jgi:hypothetical protein